MSKVLKNLETIREKIDTNTVRIIAVTKYVDTNSIIQAYEAGLRNFAESKIQDSTRKRSELPETIEKLSIWHFIGHLQKNKVKKVVGNFEYIHSLDSLELAQLISQEAALQNIHQKVLIQVNISNEVTKHGFDAKNIKEVLPEILKLNSLNVVGLMTMAPYTEDAKELHQLFSQLRELRDELQETNKTILPELSMGMSNDFEIAANEGATMIRLGRILFE